MAEPKHQLLDNEAFVTLEQCGMWYVVQLRDPAGEVREKLRFDDPDDANEAFNEFCEIGKTL